MNRRDMLRGIPVASAALVLPAVAMLPELGTKERLKHAIEELKRAAEAYNPTIMDWQVSNIAPEASDEDAAPIVIAAFNWKIK